MLTCRGVIRAGNSRRVIDCAWCRISSEMSPNDSCVHAGSSWVAGAMAVWMTGAMTVRIAGTVSIVRLRDRDSRIIAWEGSSTVDGGHARAAGAMAVWMTGAMTVGITGAVRRVWVTSTVRIVRLRDRDGCIIAWEGSSTIDGGHARVAGAMTVRITGAVRRIRVTSTVRVTRTYYGLGGIRDNCRVDCLKARSGSGWVSAHIFRVRLDDGRWLRRNSGRRYFCK